MHHGGNLRYQFENILHYFRIKNVPISNQYFWWNPVANDILYNTILLLVLIDSVKQFMIRNEIMEMEIFGIKLLKSQYVFPKL
jgi:hypothetical protein